MSQMTMIFLVHYYINIFHVFFQPPHSQKALFLRKLHRYVRGCLSQGLKAFKSALFNFSKGKCSCRFEDGKEVIDSFIYLIICHSIYVLFKLLLKELGCLGYFRYCHKVITFYALADYGEGEEEEEKIYVVFHRYAPFEDGFRLLLCYRWMELLQIVKNIHLPILFYQIKIWNKAPLYNELFS